MIKVFILTVILGSDATSKPLHVVKYYYPNLASCEVAAKQWKSRKFNQTPSTSTQTNNAFCDLGFLPTNKTPE